MVQPLSNKEVARSTAEAPDVRRIGGRVDGDGFAISGMQVVILTPSGPELRRAGKAPRPRRRVQWLALAALLTEGLVWLEFGKRHPIPEGMDLATFVPAGLMALALFGLLFASNYVTSIMVFDLGGIHMYGRLGRHRFHMSDYAWSKVEALLLDDDAIDTVVRSGNNTLDLLAGPSLTPDERLRVYEAICEIATAAGYSSLSKPRLTSASS